MIKSNDLIVVDNVVSSLNNLRLSIKTPEDAKLAIMLSSRMAKAIKTLDDNVRKVVSEVMYENSLTELKDECVELKYVQPTSTDVIDPSSVIASIGFDAAINLMQVKTGEFKKYIKKASVSGEISMKQVDECMIGKKTVNKKGYLKVIIKS